MNADKSISPVIEALEKALKVGNQEALDIFWNTVEQKGAPLIEEIPGDEQNVLLTVVWKETENIETIAVFGELFGMNTEETQLKKLPGSNLWYKTYKAPKNARSLYVFFVNEKPNAELAELDVRLDPYNSNIVTCLDDEDNPGEYCILFKRESMIELPDFKPCAYAVERSAVQKGTIEKFVLNSKLLGRSKRVWVYKPAGYEQLQKPCGSVLFMDGWEYLFETKTAVILDNMIAEGAIPPVIGIFVDNRGNRVEDLRLNTTFIDFLAQEIMSWAKDLYKLSDDPTEHLIGGFSAGGLTAAYAALLYPNVFGKVLSQSGALYWGFNDDMTGEVVVNQYEQSEPLPIDIFMSLGEFEKFDQHLNATLRMYKLLKEKGYNVLYQEFIGGHTNYDSQITLPQGLRFLLGDNK